MKKKYIIRRLITNAHTTFDGGAYKENVIMHDVYEVCGREQWTMFYEKFDSEAKAYRELEALLTDSSDDSTYIILPIYERG